MEGLDINPKWLEYIQNRVERARQWREEMDVHRELAENYRYVRILGRSFRAISISPNNPCGRLIKKDNGKAVLTSKTIKDAISNVKKAYPHDHSDDYKPIRHETKNTDRQGKPEHQMQAFLIRYALMHKQRFHDVLRGFEDELDELIFITDELSTGKLRADIIALGRKNGQYFPVFIELKVKRGLKRLIEQLEGAKALMNIAGEDFIKLLSAVSGIEENKISFEECKLIIVWPQVSGGREASRVQKARSMGFLFAEYTDKGVSEYTFTRN